MAKWDLSKLNQVGHDPVDSPVHYNQAGIECIDAIEAMTENMSGNTIPKHLSLIHISEPTRPY